MKVKKNHLINHPNINRVNPVISNGNVLLDSFRNSFVYTSKKLLAIFLSLSMTGISFATIPVYADSDVDATTAGDVSEEKQSNEPTPVRCSGGISVSDTSSLTEGDGELVCAQSNGYYTDISGNEKPSSYHWVAWYKDKLKNDVDTTNSEGNYTGFSDSKVTAWIPYADEIKDLNDGDFPEIKSYTYPTDTETSSLDFWTDLAGYYTVIGDPKYDEIEISAYEQIVYAKQTTETTREQISQASDTSGYTVGDDGVLYQTTTNPDTGEQTTTAVTELKTITTGWSSYTDCKGKIDCKVMKRMKQYQRSDGTWIRVVQKHDTKGNSSVLVKMLAPGSDSWETDNIYNGKNYFYEGYIDYKEGDKKTRQYSSLDQSRNNYTKVDETNNGVNNTIRNTWDNNFELLAEEDGDATSYIDGNDMVTEVKHISYYYTNVNIAKASIDGSVYASQLAQLPDLKITKGSGGNTTITTDNNDDTFWKETIPTYWGNEGKITLKNDSSMPYHFSAVSSNSDYDLDDDSIISLYATLPQTDKEFTFTHAYSNIKNTDLSSKQYPTNIEENCVTTKSSTGTEKQICSKKQTPLIKVRMNLNEDNPQDDVDDEVEKSVTLTKDNDKEDTGNSSDTSETTSD